MSPTRTPRTEEIAIVIIPDSDDDLYPDDIDNCPTFSNPDQIDADLDTHGLACDCNDTDATIYPGAPEINDGQDNQCSGDSGYCLVDELSWDAGFHNAADRNKFSWPAQAGAASYEIARSTYPDFSGDCVKISTADTYWVDPTWPDPGTSLNYLIRSMTPNAGSWGRDSTGAERTNVCP